MPLYPAILVHALVHVGSRDLDSARSTVPVPDSLHDVRHALPPVGQCARPGVRVRLSSRSQTRNPRPWPLHLFILRKHVPLFVDAPASQPTLGGWLAGGGESRRLVAWPGYRPFKVAS